MEEVKNRQIDRKIAELTCKLNLFDLDEILDAAIEQIPSIIQSQRVTMYLLDQEEKYLVPKRSTSFKMQEHTLEKIAVDSPHSLITHAFQKNEPILIQDIHEYIERHNLSITVSKRQRYASGSCMIIPIKVRLPNGKEKTMGVFSFSEKIDFTIFSKYDLDLGIHLTELLGTSIHNCFVVEKKLGGSQKKLLNELHEMKEAFAQKDIKLDEAKKKQIQMLPELPKLPGYDIDVFYSPMETIGGDFYDFIRIDDNQIGIVIGDVSGHGIEAALVMSMAKQILSIYSKLHRSITEILARANDEIFSNLKGESFIAVFMGILNTSTHLLRYGRAGQTYPLVFNPQREPPLLELKSNGVVLGTIRSRGDRFRAMIEEKEMQLKPGDILLLYTDGAIEASKQSGEDFSVERMIEHLLNSKDKTAVEINTYIQNKIKEFTQSPQDDDITLLCIKANEIVPCSLSVTQRVQRALVQESESFIMAPELNYDENMQYQLLHMEEKIAELEATLANTEQEKQSLQTKCEEIEHSLDMATSDPNAYVNSLKDQLKIALELPRELIAENGRLHQEIENQKRELRALEEEINQLLSNLDIQKEENKKGQEQLEIIHKLHNELPQEIQREVVNNSCDFDKKVVEYLTQRDYFKGLNLLEKSSKLAVEQLDKNAMDIYCRQYSFLIKLFLKNFQIFMSNAE